MKVNIQYSIELDEIPGKVREFLMKVAQESSSIEAGIKYTTHTNEKLNGGKTC